jgi:hypothetical protein
VARERWADPIEGVSLAQYAAVVAASAEGHGLDEALGWAGVDGGAWPKAAPAWRRALLDAAAIAAYHLELAQAEDRMHRRVPPIEEDAAAWASFMACVAEAPDVVPLLAGVGLGPNDVSRLTRAWGRCMAGDAGLRKRIAELRGHVPAVMPALRPGPRAPLAHAAPPGAPAAVEGDARSLPAAAVETLLAPALPTYLAEADRRVAVAPVLAPDAGSGSGRTLDVGDAWQAGAVLPFVEPVEAAPPAAEHGPAALIGSGPTADVSEAWRSGPVLPFSEPVEGAPAGSPPHEPQGSGATIDVSEVWRSGLVVVLPFPVSTPARTAEATIDVGEAWRSGQALPFTPPPPSPGAPRLTLEQYASLVVELAVAPARVAETLRRYGLTAADKEAHDATWRARLADDRERAAFERACATYRAWLEASTRSPGEGT